MIDAFPRDRELLFKIRYSMHIHIATKTLDTVSSDVTNSDLTIITMVRSEWQLAKIGVV
jgi:hypothetical protein